MKKKQLYLSPSTEILALQSEGIVCVSSSQAIVLSFEPISVGVDYDVQSWD